jgi:hypothetical protein
MHQTSAILFIFINFDDGERVAEQISEGAFGPLPVGVGYFN